MSDIECLMSERRERGNQQGEADGKRRKMRREVKNRK